MGVWTKEAAIAEVKTLTAEVETLRRYQAFSAHHSAWRMKTITFLRQVFGDNSLYLLQFAAFKWQHVGHFMTSAWNYEEDVERLNNIAYLNGKC